MEDATALGLIPAHAGKTSWGRVRPDPRRAHPRSRGENMRLRSSDPEGRGSSPLTRGKPATYQVTAKLGGLIPAHAGKTPCRGEQRHERGAHPRSRGENVHAPTSAPSGYGSSPLTRGKHIPPGRSIGGLGLIPAHAGKTRGGLGSYARSWAHPRSRGENTSVKPRSRIAWGSSPLTRGKLCPRAGRQDVRGLIPAHAGKTSPGRRSHRDYRAHPRSRGENNRSWKSTSRWMGSSPLTRGKHAGDRGRARRDRLIPAHAGKTCPPLSVCSSPRAHPRSRGENRRRTKSLRS